MKIAIWIADDREVLYDSVTDELVIRNIPVGEVPERVDRIAMSKVLHAYNLSRRPGSKTASVNKKRI